MTDPERIVDTEESEAAALVRAARADRPDPALAARVTAALGNAPIAPRASRSPWMAGGGVVMVVGAIAVGYGLRDDTTRAPVALPSATPATSAPPVPVAPTLRDEAVSISAESLPDAPAAPAKTSAAVSAARPSGAATAPSLEREIKLLDATKRQLQDGATSAAASELAAYEREFPNGALRREADVLRIRLELARGDRERARTLADEFIARDPNSLHAKRVRALFETP